MDWVSQKKNHYDDEFEKEINSEYNTETGYEYKTKPFCPNWNDFELLCDQDIMKTVIKKTRKAQLENNSHPNLYIQNKYNEMMEVQEKCKPWIFITIRPEDNKIKFKEFMTRVKSLEQWKPFIKGYYVFEQIGEETSRLGDGFHAHIMLEKYNIEWKRLSKRLEHKFGDICGPPKAWKNTINVKRKKIEHAKETVQDYMLGIKDNEKELKCKMDILWRQNNGIKPIYSWGVTTDKTPQKSTDGRVSNGGKRAGAGRPKTKTEPAQTDSVAQVSNQIKKFDDEIKWSSGQYTLEF